MASAEDTAGYYARVTPTPDSSRRSTRPTSVEKTLEDLTESMAFMLHIICKDGHNRRSQCIKFTINNRQHTVKRGVWIFTVNRQDATILGIPVLPGVENIRLGLCSVYTTAGASCSSQLFMLCKTEGTSAFQCYRPIRVAEYGDQVKISFSRFSDEPLETVCEEFLKQENTKAKHEEADVISQTTINLQVSTACLEPLGISKCSSPQLSITRNEHEQMILYTGTLQFRLEEVEQSQDTVAADQGGQHVLPLLTEQTTWLSPGAVLNDGEGDDSVHDSAPEVQQDSCTAPEDECLAYDTLKHNATLASLGASRNKRY